MHCQGKRRVNDFCSASPSPLLPGLYFGANSKGKGIARSWACHVDLLILTLSVITVSKVSIASAGFLVFLTPLDSILKVIPLDALFQLIDSRKSPVVIVNGPHGTVTRRWDIRLGGDPQQQRKTVVSKNCVEFRALSEMESLILTTLWSVSTMHAGQGGFKLNSESYFYPILRSIRKAMFQVRDSRHSTRGPRIRAVKKALWMI
ncbi:hypothetical protein B0F90DRAFT_1667913 [Multifurca ochricompacta]|uniref:Uncharacterized protein n=1 Tax=Multifurca ochricompacta TaxID=376703 RepID=A0AAD4M5R1_9AGAM|nr:hypothetical protein B0F90DRAFT_1667913 [Multifurca ochricompacta]